MKWWRLNAWLALAAMATMIGALGCGSSKSSGVSLTISPTVASVITNRTQQFSGLVTGSSNTAITWSQTCETGVTAGTCGSIDAAGLYTAPATIPTISSTSNGTTTTSPAPTVTITGTAQADTTKKATATLTIVTGISISITPTSATVGTLETFPFNAAVNNPGCNITSTANCEDVTWSLSTTLTGIGSISTSCVTQAGGQRLCTGVYKAPGTVPSPSTVIITATSVADTSVTATATATVVTATQPTVTSVSPNTIAAGGLFQDVYITGTNFISTNNVFVCASQLSCVQIPSANVSEISPSIIRARIPDFILAAPPSSGPLQIGVSEQSGTEQTCSGSDQSPCQIHLVNVRPGVVGPNPDRIPQGMAGVQTFNVDGGFFGTGANPASPAVLATYNGQLRGAQLPASGSIGSTRQLSVLIGGGSNSSDFSVPGLYPVKIENVRDTSKFAVTNLAVQPNYNGGSSITQIGPNLPTGVGNSSPSAVAINAATGVAVVANTGSNDVTLISFDPIAGAPALIGSICTFAPGLSEPCSTTAPAGPSGPTSVAVDDVLNEALVTNSTSNSVAVIDLANKVVTAVLALQDPPEAVTVNPETHQGLVAMQGKNYGVLVQLSCPPVNPPPNCVNTPTVTGIVSITTGTNTKVAVEPRLNWAVVSPGGAGSLAIVDLNNQSNNQITAISRTTNVVTVTVASNTAAPPIAVAPGDTVQISNVQFPLCTGTATPPSCATSQIAALAPSFDGFYTISSVGPGPNQFSYTQTNGTQTDLATQSAPQTATGSVGTAEPVAVETAPIDAQGIAVNPETQQAALVDPTTGGVVTFFSLLDQSESSMGLTLSGTKSPDVGTNAVAYNPLVDTIVAVNSLTDAVSVIDPVAPRRLNDSKLFPLACTKTCGPSSVAVDPGTNIAVVANQTDNSVSILNLGPIQPFSIMEVQCLPSSPDNPCGARTSITTSTLGSAPNPAPQTIRIIGSGFGAVCSGNLEVRLDGNPIPTSCSPAQPNRVLTATVPASMLLTAHRYALDVLNTNTNQITNAEDFTVEQGVDVSTACTVPPEPTGVAIDPRQNLVAVSLFGCNALALMNLDSASGSVVALGSNANPIGVAVLPRLHLAVVANNGTGTASIIDELQGRSLQTVGLGSGSSPMGAAANEATGEVAIANSIANTVSVVNAATGGVSTISTGQRPVAVAMNYINNQVASAAATSNLLGVSAGTTGTASQTFSVAGPSSVVYDPVPTDCGSNNNGATTNTTGCFIVASAIGNLVQIIDPITSAQTGFRVGIDPGSIAYNYFTGTLISTNLASHTISVADVPGLSVRSLLPLPPIVNTTANQAFFIAASGVPQYQVDVNPLTNIAVIADTPNGRVLFVPLPR